MSANPNWPRWIFATVSKHFTDAAAVANLPMFIEGQHRNTRKLKDFFELRMDGPTLREVSKGCWVLRIEVNILVQSTMNDSNYHRIHQNVGILSAAFVKSIAVFKLGKDDPDPDDQTFLGCLNLLQNRESQDFLEINHFGQIEVNTKLVQASVEGHYSMLLQTS